MLYIITRKRCDTVGHVTILSTILLSFPEYLCACIIGLLLIGKHDMLTNKRYYFRIFLYTAISCIGYFFTRPIISGSIEWLPFYIVSSTFLYVFIFRFQYFESLMASTFQLIIIFLLDISITTIFIHIFNLNAVSAVSTEWLLFIMSIFVRFIHILLIVFIFRRNFKIIDFKNKPLKYKKYYASLFLYLMISLILILLLLTLTKILLLGSNNLDILLHTNIYVVPAMILLLVLAMKNDNSLKKKQTELSKKEFIQNLNYIDNLIKKGRLNEASDSLNTLKDFISTNDIT
jgi:hypothetical protein